MSHMIRKEKQILFKLPRHPDTQKSNSKMNIHLMTSTIEQIQTMILSMSLKILVI